MANFPGPYTCRFYYTTSVAGANPLQHKMELSLNLDGDPDPGDLFPSIGAIPSGGGAAIALDVVVDAWAAAAAAFYSNTAGNSWDSVELWRYVSQSFDATFISAYTLGENGTSASATSEAAQSIVTFRSTFGSNFRLAFMESVIVPGSIDTRPFTNAALDDLVDDVLLGSVYPWVARDNGWPFAVLRHFPGQNEALWKRRRRAGV